MATKTQYSQINKHVFKKSVMTLPRKGPYYLMFADQYPHITNLSFILLNDFCDFHH